MSIGTLLLTAGGHFASIFRVEGLYFLHSRDSSLNYIIVIVIIIKNTFKLFQT